jgi:hypothetical protein
MFPQKGLESLPGCGGSGHNGGTEGGLDVEIDCA